MTCLQVNSSQVCSAKPQKWSKGVLIVTHVAKLDFVKTIVADVGCMLEALAQPFDQPILRKTHGAVLLRSAGPDFQIRPEAVRLCRSGIFSLKKP
jgi:hypothetical protein